MSRTDEHLDYVTAKAEPDTISQVDPLAELIKILDIGNPNYRTGFDLARVSACEAILKYGGKSFVRSVRDKVRTVLGELASAGPDTTCRVRAAIVMLEHDVILGGTRLP